MVEILNGNPRSPEDNLVNGIYCPDAQSARFVRERQARKDSLKQELALYGVIGLFALATYVSLGAQYGFFSRNSVETTPVVEESVQGGLR